MLCDGGLFHVQQRIYDEYLPVLESKKSVLNEKLAIVTAKIDALKAEGVSNDTLSELLIEKEDLKNDIKILDELITDGATVDTSTFNLKLQIAYNRLNNLTTNLTNCQKEVLSSKKEKKTFGNLLKKAKKLLKRKKI